MFKSVKMISFHKSPGDHMVMIVKEYKSVLTEVISSQSPRPVSGLLNVFRSLLWSGVSACSRPGDSWTFHPPALILAWKQVISVRVKVTSCANTRLSQSWLPPLTWFLLRFINLWITFVDRSSFPCFTGTSAVWLFGLSFRVCQNMLEMQPFFNAGYINVTSQWVTAAIKAFAGVIFFFGTSTFHFPELCRLKPEEKTKTTVWRSL